VDILEYCLDYRKKCYADTGQYPISIYLNLDKFNELLCKPELFNGHPHRPTPPVKKRDTKIIKGGFFTSDHFVTDIEYDHHAPDYLRELDIYYKEIERSKKEPLKYFIYGMEVNVTE